MMRNNIYKICKLFILFFFFQQFTTVAYAEKGTHVVTRVTKNRALIVFSQPDKKSDKVGNVFLGDTIKVQEEMKIGMFEWVKFDCNGKPGYLKSKYVRAIGQKYRPGFEKLGLILIISLIVLCSILAFSRNSFDFEEIEYEGTVLYVNTGIFILASIIALILGFLSMEDYYVDAFLNFGMINTNGFITLILSIIALAAFLFLLYNYYKTFRIIMNQYQMKSSYFTFGMTFGLRTSIISAIAGLILYHTYNFHYLKYVFIFYGITQLTQIIIILYKTAPKYSYGIVASLVLTFAPMSMIIFLAPLLFRMLIFGLVIAVIFGLFAGKIRKRSNHR